MLWGGLRPGNVRVNSGPSDCHVCRGWRTRRRCRHAHTDPGSHHAGFSGDAGLGVRRFAGPRFAGPRFGTKRRSARCPGAASDWVTGDKDGFGTARGTDSKVWYTLNNGELSEIYYPRIDTPSTRDTQLVVTDGRTFTDRETTDTIHRVRLLDPESLSYQQIDTARSGKYVITKTYVTVWGARNPATVLSRSLRGPHVFVDEAAEYGSARDPLSREVGDGIAGPGRVQLTVAVGPPSVVVPGILAQDAAQVSHADDQHSVGSVRRGWHGRPSYSVSTRRRWCSLTISSRSCISVGAARSLLWRR